MSAKIFNSVLGKFSLLQKQLEIVIEKQQEKLNHLTTKLTTKALAEITLKRTRFLISLVIITVFVVEIVALTSY